MMRDGIITDYEQGIKDNDHNSELLPIRPLKTISGGRSGAKVFKVEYGKKKTLAVLKINEKDEVIPSQRALKIAYDQKREGNIAKVIHSCELVKKNKKEYVVLYELAGDNSEPKMLIDLIEEEQDVEPSTLKEIIDFLFDWKSNSCDCEITPAQMVIRELGHKYKDEKFINAYKSLGITTQHFSIKYNRIILPNPVLFLENRSAEDNSLMYFDLSISHNDFHGGNIILDGNKPKIIDFAELKTDSNVFYDLMYLEFHLIFDYIQPENERNLKTWIDLCQDISNIDIYDISIKKGKGASILRNVIPIMRKYLINKLDYRNTNSKTAILTAAISVGLNVMRRSSNIFERKAGFIYASHFLDALLRLQGIDWFDMKTGITEMEISDTDDERRTSSPENNSNRNIDFKYSFLPYDAKATVTSNDERMIIKKNRIFLDVGHSMTTGAIDVHDFLGGYSSGKQKYESTMAYIAKMPSLILDNITDDAVEVELVAHISPDFDCVASFYTARQLIIHGKLPENVDKLVDYTEAIDKGEIRVVNGCLNVPFVIMQIIEDIIKEENPTESNKMIFEKTMNRGIELIDYSMNRLERIQEGEKSLYNYSILSSTKLFQKEYEQIENDYSLYLEELESSKKPIKYNVLLPMDSHKKEVFALFWHDIPKCKLHKHWARIDYNSPDGKGYTMTLIPLEIESISHDVFGVVTVSRVIIAVKPEIGVSLIGFGKLLEEAEVKKENDMFGEEKNLWRSREDRRYKESWCDNTNPWYDGRGHNFTIVDAPRGGSLLTVDEIVEITLNYTKATKLSDGI